jgi:hypothetical protein
VYISIHHDEIALTDDTGGQKISNSISLWPAALWQKPRVVAWLLVGLFMLALAQPRPAHAAPRLQSNPGTSPQLYLLPRDAANNNVIVDTHIATLRVVDDAAGPQLNVNAVYQLHNPADSDVTLPLMLFPGGDQSLGGFQNLSLTRNDDVLLLQPGDGGGYFSQTALSAGERATLTLRYQVSLGNDSIATVRYAPSILNGWAGNISLRVELELPNTIPAESWIETMPADWRYSVVTDPTVIGLRWLYDFNIPEEPLRLRFITPRVWSELRATENTVANGGAVSAFVHLGDLYSGLVRIAPSDSARQQFYAQAIAAYSGGLASPAFALASPSERAALHIGLADLYRRRLVEAAASEQGDYADLMVAEIVEALAILPADDARTTELRQWQTDGWQLQLNHALDQRDWPAALTLVEELAKLPAGVIDPTVIAEDRRYILIQQALDLMEQGNREAALAIAGDQISADALQPPAQSATLFSGWQLTLTVSPDAMQLIALGLTQPQRHAEALDGLKEVVKLWQNGTSGEAYSFQLEEIPTEVSLQSGVRLQITFPAEGNGFLLARLLPPRTDYALLRGLLTQLAPTIKRNTGVIWQQIEIRQPLNLSSVVNEWNSIAAGLEEEAAGFEAQSDSLHAEETSETSSAEAALTAQIQAVNYRTTAAEWRRLARQSSLLVSFQINDPVFTRFKGEPPARAWTVTAAAPSQTFVFQTQVLNLNRLLMGAALAFVLLIAVAGLLWGLL